jgi:orotidine-5'-phosphate decarboxylase
MKTKFQKKWEQISKKRKSLIIAGCDPKVGTKNILNWCKKYCKEVEPNVSGIKPNPAYFQTEEGIKALKWIAKFCKSKNLVSIVDYKISDIGSTNVAWITHAKKMGYDAITIAPYAGNIKETIQACKELEIGSIMMGLMSNPEFILETEFEMNSKKLMTYRVETSLLENVDALVLGATYKKEDKLFQDFLKLTKDKEVIFLVPGIGFQGGSIKEFLQTGIDPKKCMLNVGRALMYPEKVTRREVAKKLREETNLF